MVTILGPTASGKTTLAVNLAKEINSEIISADSRQVYKDMDIGTGKDLEEYTIDGLKIPFHLIDIVDAGYEYNVFEFQRDFITAYTSIIEKDKRPILCGGTGMYLEAALKGYKLIKVPENIELRTELSTQSDEELILLLQSLKTTHNTSDLTDRKRLIRAIEIERFHLDNPNVDESFPKINNIIFGIQFEREETKKRITERLAKRLENGMIEEVEKLLVQGVSADKLYYYGLEYRFLSQYILGNLDYSEMFGKLNKAIHKFAKRQMTWYRRMEKNGIDIIWLEGNMDLDEKIFSIFNNLKKRA